MWFKTGSCTGGGKQSIKAIIGSAAETRIEMKVDTCTAAIKENISFSRKYTMKHLADKSICSILRRFKRKVCVYKEAHTQTHVH